MYDAIIVGARCAGSATALQLARRGHRVLVVDKASFPSDTMSTHFVHQSGVSRLRAWGLADDVAASGAPASTSFTIDFGPLRLSGHPQAADGTATAYAPRRRVLDQILLVAAVEAGAEVRERFTVTDLVYDDGRVAGIRGHGADGRPVTERARVVVGADGLNSVVARLVDAKTYIDRGTLSCAYYTYWEDVPAEGLTAYVRPEFSCGVFPTNDGLTCIPVSWPRARFDEIRADYERHYLAALDSVPEIGERVRAGTRAERFVGTGNLPNQFRQSAGPGWALVGDAGHHKDPCTARGISDAFAHSELLVDAIHHGLTGVRPLDGALVAYQESRDSQAMPFFEFSLPLAALEPPPPHVVDLQMAMVGNQAAMDAFVGLIAGTTRVEDFFAPDNLGAIMSAAA